MLTKQDINMLAAEMDSFFQNLPKTSYFSFKWYKSNLKPLARTFAADPVADFIPGFKVPYQSDIELQTPEGKMVQETTIRILIPKRWGETLVMNNLTYVGGIQPFDKMTTQEGDSYVVKQKESQGFGAYYRLTLEREEGHNNEFLASQYNR